MLVGLLLISISWRSCFLKPNCWQAEAYGIPSETTGAPFSSTNTFVLSLIIYALHIRQYTVNLISSNTW